jgi:hypothetical protein
MLTVCNKTKSHTQTTTGKQRKPRKEENPKSTVWCGLIGLHTHTKKKKAFCDCFLRKQTGKLVKGESKWVYETLLKNSNRKVN